MTHTLFLHSEVQDPYAIYAERLATQPVFHDGATDLWAVYSYDACKAILESTSASIPALGDRLAHLLSPAAASLSGQLVRLSNPPLHAPRKRVAMHLHALMAPVDIEALLDELLAAKSADAFDWVDAVCKVLPPLVVLKSFGFSDEDIALILPRVAALTTIMRPNKSETQIQEVNDVVATVHPVVARHLECMQIAIPSDIENTSAALREVYVSNLIGLLIQSYDAGRGLLSNALLQMLNHPAPRAEQHRVHQNVIETLRFDPPIHNTRRVLTEDVTLHGSTLKKGQTVLLVLAAANRDPARFPHPERYDVTRPNNDQHLTFGAGVHLCVARHLSVRVAVDALTALFARYAHIELRQPQIAYEPLLNARLPKEIRIGIR